MIGYGISESKKLFFDRKAVQDAVGKVEARIMGKAGSNLMTTARRSMRKARMKSRGDMTAAEIRTFDLRIAKWKKGGQKGSRPKRPLASSKPGEPPRVRRGDIRQNLFFIFDPSSKSVVVGPAKLARATGAPSTLEFGGSTRGSFGKTVKIAKRPYMAPALAKEQPKISALWKDSIKK